jgi:hypothetical protein
MRFFATLLGPPKAAMTSRHGRLPDVLWGGRAAEAIEGAASSRWRSAIRIRCKQSRMPCEHFRPTSSSSSGAPARRRRGSTRRERGRGSRDSGFPPPAAPYCPEHDQRAARRGARTQAHGRNTPEWRALSRTRRAQAGRCELSLDDRCTGQPDTAHLNPDAPCWPDHRLATLDDVRAACRHCHGVADAPRATPNIRYQEGLAR